MAKQANKNEGNYQVVRAFRDKETKQMHEVGEDASHFTAERMEVLKDKGLVAESKD